MSSPLPLPAAASMDDGAPDWGSTSGWQLQPRDAGLAWVMTNNTGNEILLWEEQIDLRSAQPTVMLSFDSQFIGNGIGTVQISTDHGTTWLSVSQVSASADWTTESVGLSGYVNHVIELRFVWQAMDTTTMNQWGVDNVVIANVAPPTPMLSLTETTITAETAEPTAVSAEGVQITEAASS